ncbi:MAG: diphosphomevalonate decarboxylase [Herpetosiphonaceae bacterium]|nr:MAG: diphosphomevalonate decarboxylase [Herpetosiphonaceae bacterium]
MAAGQATAIAPANIAFIKYWGVLDSELTLPTNGSISMCLDRCTTETHVRFEEGLDRDEVLLDLYEGVERPAEGRAYERVVAHLDRLRAMAGVNLRARVRSRNSFPADAGIASSAAAFSALTVAGAAALGLNLSEQQLSVLARLSGSGSACRSIPDGFVEWINDGTSTGSYARSIAPPEHWQLCDIVAVVDVGAKQIASEAGHKLAFTSPYFPVRLQEIPERIERARRAILERDLATLGEVMEADAISMHTVAMTTRPPAFYWSAGTMAIIQAVRRWRDEGLACYFTIDAGPNVHVLCPVESAAEIEARLCLLPEVQFTIVNLAGPGARVVKVS